MKAILAVLLVLLSFGGYAQPTVTAQFQKIKTVDEAQKYIDANAELKPALLRLSHEKDTTLIDKRLMRQKQGDVFSVGYVTYKVLESTESVKYRSSYIFLDGGSLSPSEIEALKKEITEKIAANVPFEKLSDQYTMDGNTTHGDTGWFFGPTMFPAEFQDAVAKHKTGDVFFVDVSDKDWHYIVKKTHDDDLKKEITVLRSNGR